MVASIRNISARSVIIKQDVPPPPPPGIYLRTTSAEMAHWGTYITDYPTAIQAGGTYDSGTLGSLGSLSGGDLIADFTGVGTVLGTASLTMNNSNPPQVYEFLVQVSYPVYLGYWNMGFGPPYDADTAGGSDFASYYASDGTLYSYFGGGSASPFTTGDVIGVVAAQFATMQFYKNGISQGTVGVVSVPGPIMASRSAL